MAQDLSTQDLRNQLLCEWVSLDVKGEPMQAYMARPQGEGPWPAVVVLMEIFGVNAHIQDVTQRIAAEGYVAIAPNYYHRTTQNMELGYTQADATTGFSHKEQTTRAGLLDDLQATIEFLKQQPTVGASHKMGCIGFCFGGHVAFIAATLPEISATAAFYPGGVATSSPGGGEPTVESVGDIHGQMLCLFGMEDPLIPAEDNQRIEQALKAANRRYEVIRYANTGHGFFCNQRADFDPSAAEDAWMRVRTLFSTALKS
ncbi:dienelactone hydrolase family protein [Vampirovibrio sp.]|uniref:dienelactone hydrolase family protein n=1 Tax=Vampirovibrio sp. TaxID=2717857 RepID=UPI00359418B8